jgi:hypothetical protein
MSLLEWIGFWISEAERCDASPVLQQKFLKEGYLLLAIHVSTLAFRSRLIASLSKVGATVQTLRMNGSHRLLLFLPVVLPVVVMTAQVMSAGAAGATDEELPVIRRSFAEVVEPVPQFTDGRFEPAQGETISWIGGTEVADLDRYPFLESAIQLAWPTRDLHFRNLAWQGDTVYRQARPLYFYTIKSDPQPGSIADHRERTEPGIIFIAFGKMESLEGPERLPDFVAAYAELLDDLAPLTSRVVLVEPTPFFHSGPAEAYASERSFVLSSYVEAIKRLAAERDLLFVRSGTEWNAGMSDNGVHLNEAGHRIFAWVVRDQIGASQRQEDSPSLHDAIVRKNLLWQQYYRPTNWAFLFGDRQSVPASRDDKNRDERWFVREIDALPGLIAEAEADIHRYAKEAAK